MQLKWSQLDSLFCGYSPAALASILLCWLAIAVSATEALAQTQSERPVISQQVRYPHSNGYQLGDKFTHVLQIEMRRPYTLVEDSLPSVGRVSGHIELQRVGVDKQSKLGSRVYTIDLQYQVINYDDGLVGTSVPPAIVSFATETDVYPVVIEPWGLTLSPFLMKETRNHGDMPKLEMLADQTRIPLLGKVLSCVLLALAGIGLLMPSIRGTLIIPFIERRNQPFVTAHRNIVKIAADESAPSFEEALRCLHEAFNRKLGRAVLNEDIAAFLQKYPVFDGKQKDIKRFFEISDQHFFGNGLSPSGIKDNLSFVTAFAAAMRRSEWSAGFRRANDSGRQGIESNAIESTQSAWLKR